MRITCPPITNACHFGVDMGHDDDLMAARLSIDEIRAAHRRRLARLPVARRHDARHRRHRHRRRARSRPTASATPATPAATRSRSARPSPSWASKACWPDARPRHRLGWPLGRPPVGVPPARSQRQPRRRRSIPPSTARSTWSSSAPRARWPPASPIGAPPPACRASDPPPSWPGSRRRRATPARLAAQLGLPSPRFHRSDDHHDAITWWREAQVPVVVKLDGLAAGKGVIVPEHAGRDRRSHPPPGRPRDRSCSRSASAAPSAA